MRTVVLRVVALALLLLLAIVAVLTMRTLNRLPGGVVYFVRAEPTTFTLEPVGRQVEGSTPEARLAGTVEALITGPTAEEQARGLSSTIPPDVKLLDLSLEDGTVTINLSKAFEEGGGSAAMIGRLNQLFYTLTQPEDTSRVILLIQGEPVKLFGGEGIIIERPWQRPEQEALPVW